ncbi:MAG: Gfo/Idh/MocA family oxidoreductase [Kiritimatiellae bacterium]|nr:Gfo/Idh/MocA family oxidoreductase [Kiritimatiellia bacterium]
MLRVGIVGLGFMGRMHYRCWHATPNAEVSAACDANPDVIEAAKRAGNVEGAAARIDWDALQLSRTLGEMLAKNELDAVSITVPTFLHAELTEQALKAGVHVLCEKPMGLDVAECDRMIAAADASGKVLQIGHCLRFWPEYAKAKEIVDSGEYGRLVAASFQRLSPRPGWAADNWFADTKRSGGIELDLHIHDADFVQWLLGVPPALCSSGARGAGGGFVHIATQFLYDAGQAVTAEASWMMAPSAGFRMSFQIMLERATLLLDPGAQPAFRVCPAEGEPFAPELPEGDGYAREIEHFARRVQGEKLPDVITPEQARDSIRIGLAARESAQNRQKVTLA